MRQVFIEFPWVHRAAPSELLTFFKTYGRYEKLAMTSTIYNGGIDGEVAWVLSGLGAFAFQDARDNTHIFSLIPAGRMMGNVDGFSGRVVNVIDFALRETEVLLMPRAKLLNILREAPVMHAKHTQNVIDDHESDLEGMIATMTLSVEECLRRLLLSLMLKDACRERLSEELSQTRLQTIAIPYALSNTEMAWVVGATRVRVSQIMSAWEREGFILRQGKQRFVAPSLFENIYDWLEINRGPESLIGHSRRKIHG